MNWSTKTWKVILPKKNPYQQWIDNYSVKEFGLLVAQSIGVCHAVTPQCTEKQQQAMTVAFINGSWLEFQLWGRAYP